MTPSPPPPDAASADDRPSPSPRRAIGAVWSRWPGLWGIPLVMAAAAWSETALTQGPVLCPWRWLSGMPCAACGLTRGFVALAHGHVEAAHSYHPFTGGVFAAMIAWWLVAVVSLTRGRPPPALGRRVWAMVALLGLVWWAARTVDFWQGPDPWAAMQDVSPLVRMLVRSGD